MLADLSGHRRLEVRTTIVQAARKAFVRGNYEQLSMRSLANELKCVPGTLYLYFRNKDELLEAIVDEGFATLERVLLELPQHPDPFIALKAGVRAYIAFGLHHPEHYRCSFHLRLHDKKAYRPHRAYAILQNLVSDCLRTRRMRSINAETACQVLWAGMHGLTSLLITRPNFPWVERDLLIRECVDTLVGGLLRVEPAPTSRRSSNGHRSQADR